MKGEVYLCTACLADFPFSDQAYAIQEDVLLNFDAAYRPEKLFSLFYYKDFAIIKEYGTLHRPSGCDFCLCERLFSG